MPMTTTNNDDDLRARVDELNAQLDDLISPRSGKSSLDWTRHGSTTAISLHNSKSNSGDDALLSPTTSDASSQRGLGGVIRDGLSMTTATTTTTIADHARKSRFMKNNSTVDELIDEYSLDGIDSIKEDIIFDNFGAGGMRTTHHREENAHPNHLMEYFYGQIKLAK